jgi:hypothetical protein
MSQRDEDCVTQVGLYGVRYLKKSELENKREKKTYTSDGTT